MNTAAEKNNHRQQINYRGRQMGECRPLRNLESATRIHDKRVNLLIGPEAKAFTNTESSIVCC